MIPVQWTDCKEAGTDLLLSLQITFENNAGETYAMGRVGPVLEGAVCTEHNLSNEFSTDQVYIFEDASVTTNRVTGVSLLFEDLFRTKHGAPSTEYLYIDMDPTENMHIVGFWGSTTDFEITELGVILQDTQCTYEEAQKVIDEAARKAQEEKNLNANDKPIDEEEDNGVVIIIVVCVILIAIIILIAILLYCCVFKRKRNQGISKVQMLKKSG